jgi:diamine N-acetyltransferase
MLSSPRINLRKIEPQDLPFLYLVENDDKGWGSSSVHNPLSQSDLRAYIESTTGDIFKDSQLRLIIESTSEDKTTYGVIDLFDLDLINRNIAVGIYICLDYRQQGIAKDALELLSSYTLSVLGLRMVYASVASKHHPSRNLFAAAGYKQAAVIPNFLRDDDLIVFTRT